MVMFDVVLVLKVTDAEYFWTQTNLMKKFFPTFYLSLLLELHAAVCCFESWFFQLINFFNIISIVDCIHHKDCTHFWNFLSGDIFQVFKIFNPLPAWWILDLNFSLFNFCFSLINILLPSRADVALSFGGFICSASKIYFWFHCTSWSNMYFVTDNSCWIWLIFPFVSENLSKSSSNHNLIGNNSWFISSPF